MTVYKKFSARVDFKAELLTSFEKILNSLFLDNVFIHFYVNRKRQKREKYTPSVSLICKTHLMSRSK